MRIESAKGTSPDGTLLEVWAWQEMMQGAFPSLIIPEWPEPYQSVDISECCTLAQVERAIEEDVDSIEIRPGVWLDIWPCADLHEPWRWRVYRDAAPSVIADGQDVSWRVAEERAAAAFAQEEIGK